MVQVTLPGQLSGRGRIEPAETRAITAQPGPWLAMGQVLGTASRTLSPKPIYILNGPNLNLLGDRQPEIYGRLTLDMIAEAAAAEAKKSGLATEFRQTNHEGVLVDWIHEAGKSASAIILNAGALTHTSIALLDALAAVPVPAIEVHLSNVFRREAFRHTSYPAQAALGVIAGFGVDSYRLAIAALAARLAAPQPSPISGQ
jgi:3-dehydroquinate dehydratase-2